MSKDYPVVRDPSGQSLNCASCGQPLPEGCFILAHFTPSGHVSGVRAQTPDGQVLHECGTRVGKGEGEHG